MPLIFPDPIYGRVTLPDSLRNIVESPVMARLRNIRQLGFTSASYPGAVHTRFEHAIGTCQALFHLMEQFGVQDSALREKLMLAAMLSEIGIFPLSYSARAVFMKYAMDKREYGKQLFDAFLKVELGIDYFTCVHSDEHAAQLPWWSRVRELGALAYLTPIKLASTIDYVLRDSYYTGRHVGTFDYRYFCSLRDGSSHSTQNAIRQSLFTLHRAINSLNIAYGDPVRRLLSQVLMTLVDIATDLHCFDLKATRDPNVYINYDDSTFFAELKSAVQKAENHGGRDLSSMLEVVLQKILPPVERTNSRKKDFTPDDYRVLRKQISRKRNVAPWQVFFVGVDVGEPIGFRLFGTDFRSYQEAVHSKMFRHCTGLDPKLDEVLSETENVEFVVVAPTPGSPSRYPSRTSKTAR